MTKKLMRYDSNADILAKLPTSVIAAIMDGSREPYSVMLAMAEQVRDSLLDNYIDGCLDREEAAVTAKD